MKKAIMLLSLLVIWELGFGQGRYFGAEIGGKGLKLTLLDIKSIETGQFTIVKAWTRNTAISRGISVDGKLRQDDILETASAIKEILDQAKIEFKLPDNRIFLIASSGVGLATNKQDLGDKIKELTGRDLEFVSAETEGKLVSKGAVPPSKYLDSFIFDWGGSNSKGSIIISEAGKYVCQPLAYNFGSVTLTERIKKSAKSSDFKDFVAAAIQFNDTLRSTVKFMFDNKGAAKRRPNVYMVGGAVWAFVSLTKPTQNNAYETISYQDIKNYQYDIINDFEKFESQADQYPNIGKALDTYSRESLLAGSYLMLTTISELSNPDQKKLYFVRQGHVAWIIAYVVDSVRKQQ